MNRPPKGEILSTDCQEELLCKPDSAALPRLPGVNGRVSVQGSGSSACDDPQQPLRRDLSGACLPVAECGGHRLSEANKRGILHVYNTGSRSCERDKKQLVQFSVCGKRHTGWRGTCLLAGTCAGRRFPNFGVSNQFLTP
eukprot:5136238-Amphidinium_carterae.1